MTLQEQSNTFAVCAVLAVYFLPSIIGLARGKTGMTGLIVVNTLFGWTALGWIICGIWANGETRRQAAAKLRDAEARAREDVDRRIFYHYAAGRINNSTLGFMP